MEQNKLKVIIFLAAIDFFSDNGWTISLKTEIS